MKTGDALRANYVVSDYPKNDSSTASLADEYGGNIKVG